MGLAMNLEALLSDRLAAALETVAGRPVDPAVRRSQHADLQSGAALALARELRRAPREIAAEVVDRAELAGVATAEVSGPGFVNLVVDDALIAAAAGQARGDERLGVPVVARPETVVIDYSAPNVAKELHIGHLRSTVIGDAAARLARARRAPRQPPRRLGHAVRHAGRAPRRHGRRRGR